MRAFLQKKAGATYFNGSAVTVNVRKSNLEFIFALEGGWHAVVSVVPSQDGVILIACLGSISDELNRVLPTLKVKQDEHTQFFDLLERKGEYEMVNVNVEGNEMVGGIGKIMKGKRMPHLQLLGDREVQVEAQKICNLALSVYWDLFKSEYALIKGLSKYFYDR